ncbi:MAG: primosomal protein N' [Ruminococcaceae bacterium]|nr:primosomal protein N' [Oscillospiraceae bacterium]
MLFEYAGVYLLDQPYFLDHQYDYFIPVDLREHVRVGGFVSVPFGTANRPRLAVVHTLRHEPEQKGIDCKPIRSVCHEELSLSEEMLGLCLFMKEQTLCTVGDAVRAIIPASVLSHLEEIYRPSAEPSEADDKLDAPTLLICAYIRKRGSVSLELLKAKFGPATAAALTRLRRLGLVERDYIVKNSEEKKKYAYALAVTPEQADSILADTDKAHHLRSEKHTALLHCVRFSEADAVEEGELLRAADATRAQLNAVCDKGLLRRLVLQAELEVEATPAAEARQITLNDEQSEAFDTLCGLMNSGEPRAALLHGVTGSGKTSVMLCAIDRVLQNGKGAIVLLPEISLTPQTLAIFCSRYGQRVAVIHSGLTPTERFKTYRRIRDGQADVVIGTRSAVFAPVQSLGLIVIDEEQEHTYKSDMNPKYHAKDIARYRCHHHKALMLLASATPSLESYRKAEEGKYTLIRLTHRYGNAVLPRTILSDMRDEVRMGNTSPLGSLLCRKLVQTVSEGNQAILFINRRGYNNFFSCRDCGEAVRCPDCSVSMTYHTLGNSYDTGELRCHWCGKRLPVPSVCPSCGGEHLVRMGYGTQRIEQELSALLPNARILRMDTDTTASRYAYEDMLGKFRRHEADILLGTQMVTKGHDFPDVTLVGILLADASLYLDDYRAQERTFAMLTQVIGRAGRAKRAGEAVIQTNNPDHDCIRLACTQDYESFYRREIGLRRALTFPPFCDMALLTLSGADEAELGRASAVLSDLVQSKSRRDYPDVPLVCYGPFEAPVYKVENRYRMRMVVKCRLNKRTRAMLSELLLAFSQAGTRSVSLSIDLNPSTL